MDRWEQIRRVARARHEPARVGGATCLEVVRKALEIEGLVEVEFTPGVGGHGQDVEARLERSCSAIYVSRELSPKEAAEKVAHELGHFYLHADPMMDDDEAPNGSGDEVKSSVAIVGYSRRQVKEQQADLFADEFLCPSSWLRGRLRDGATLASVAAEIGASDALVRRQTIAALITGDAATLSPPEVPDLDAEQAACVARRGGDTLVLGGPGTGKTTTLRARLRSLMWDEIPPADTLTLVATEQAAEVTRAFLEREGRRLDERKGVEERSTDARWRAASEAWVGTVAGVAAEIVVRWPRHAGLRDPVASLDRTAALDLLAQVLTRETGSPPKPSEVVIALKAVDALRASRAAGIRPARGAKGVRAAIAKAYETALAMEENAVDGGGVIPTAIAALESNHEFLTQLRRRFRHVLVDDLQDLAPAEWRLIDLLSPKGHGLWATGDVAQLIGRFRGADGTPLGKMTERRAVTTNLRHNYRAGPGPDAVLGRLRGERVSAGGAPKGTVSLTVTSDLATEARAIAARIRDLSARKVALRDQVLLCASHDVLEKLVAELRRLGIPLAHPGDVPTRDDVRGCLGLVALAKHDDPKSFVEAAALPPYRVPPSSALIVKRLGRDLRSLRAALSMIKDGTRVPGISPSIARSLARLAEDVENLRESSAIFPVLLEVLLSTDGLVRRLLRPDRAGTCMSDLVALHHLLRTCQEHDDTEAKRRGRLDERVRRMGSLLQDTNFRRVFPTSAGVDAVAVSTIHAARGNEFEAVHLCGANGFKSDDGAESFLVAASRARSHLHITRSERHGYTGTRPSPHLTRIAPVLPG